MNGVHDAGGMECYGAVVREEDEPVFHAVWERRVFGLAVSLGGALGNIDSKRHAIERMNPADYLTLSYYERWLARTELRAKETGVLSEEELRSGNASEQGRSTRPPLPPDAVPAALRKGSPAAREPQRPEPRFKVGETVTARNMNPRAGIPACPATFEGNRALSNAFTVPTCFPTQMLMGSVKILNRSIRFVFTPPLCGDGRDPRMIACASTSGKTTYNQ